MNPLVSWRPTATWEVLQARARILRLIRSFFDERGFFEVQTPCLSRDVVVDRYIEPLSIEVFLPQGRETFWLQTSPEFAMKRLLAAGAGAIYQIGPAFRAHESGDQHNVEFTMLEWYRAGDDYEAGMQLLDDFAQVVIGTPPAQRLTFREAFSRFAAVDPFDGNTDFELVNELMDSKIAPALATLPAVILYDWPAEQAALARTRISRDGHEVAERFELFSNGLELANGYHELRDADELLRRNHRINALRKRDGRPELPVNSQLLAAMKNGLPPASGVALGMDRLVMRMLQLARISDVMSFDCRNA
jgi:lysyl-tRNA synthetase class 2